MFFNEVMSKLQREVMGCLFCLVYILSCVDQAFSVFAIAEMLYIMFIWYLRLKHLFFLMAHFLLLVVFLFIFFFLHILG